MDGLVNNAGTTVSSIASATGHFPPAYTASKWALNGLSRVASLELGRLGIRVNTMFPGLWTRRWSTGVPDAIRELLVADSTAASWPTAA